MANFFSESKAFSDRNRQLFNFIHTSSVALWNLRWQVQGFMGVRPEATAEELTARFASGTNIRANNLKGACIDITWEDQLNQFAQIVSSNLIAMYEGWAEELMPKFGAPQLTAHVQWPSQGRYGNTGKGVGEALAQARASGTSTAMKSAFFPVYSASRKYSPAHLDAMLAMYRYHKEIRNSLMHRGGTANDKAEAAWRNASTLTRSDIGGRSSPALTQQTEGMMVRTNIGEAIQLSDILYRLVSTIDAELCYTSLAEQDFLSAWRNNPEWGQKFRQLPGDPVKRSKRIVVLCHSCGYATPADTEPIYQLGKSAGVAI